MASDMENALQIIKSSGLLQATKIVELEDKIANLEKQLKGTVEANYVMKAEIQGLTRNLQAKSAIIDAMHQNFANCLKANLNLELQVQLKFGDHL
jgi:predicted  nucleic acid-binding Zn-ribbon protein